MNFLCFSILAQSKDFDRTKGIFYKFYKDNIAVINASGSSKQKINGTKQLTKPEYAIDQIDKAYDWCSNCGRSKTDFPWITLSLKDRYIDLEGYYLRSGCCNYAGCCCEEVGYCISCCLYSWSLQISNDGLTWTTVHNVSKDWEAEYCAERSYKFDKKYTTRYVRLIQTEACPGDPPCIALNRLDLYGEVIGGAGFPEDFVSFHDDDDDVSIIGHLSKNNRI